MSSSHHEPQVFYPAASKRSWFTVRAASALAIAAIGSFAGLAAQGCGGDGATYHCDDTGCFNCDGLGCTAVPAPTPPTCSYAGDPTCTAGTVCTDLGCEAPCKVTTDCAKGLLCRAGFCAPPTAKAPTPKVCTLASDCPAGDACIDGACVPTPACTGDGCKCIYSSDCGTGRICADGACVIACSATSPCAAGLTCSEKGICVESTTATCGASAAGKTCPTGEHCVDGHCAGGCSASSPCLGTDGKADPAASCVAGACVVNEHPTPGCGAGKSCPTGETCIGGFCRYSCSGDDMCKAIDARIGACSKRQSICLSPAEANAACLSSADCTAGQSCIANACK